MKVIPIFWVALILSGQITSDQVRHSSKNIPVKYPIGYSAYLNKVYTKLNDWEGLIDIYLPPRTDKPTPIIINIHGGGWNHGAKESQIDFETYFNAGFAVANIEYRVSKQATAPAAIQDSRSALFYLIKNARELNIDTNKIVVMGSSAGAHLALMVGLLENDHIFDGENNVINHCKVAAIIDKYGITDVWDWAYGTNIQSKSATTWLGTKKTDIAFAKAVSPVSNLKKSSPPIFIVHGDSDPVVPYRHSIDLHNKLLQLGVKNEFLVVKGGQHGNFEKNKNAEINEAIIKFLMSLDALKPGNPN
ncbi:MAG: alpha/beta hydrolase [Bacteroidetes bacterium]|nr:alpha/beta hydrolase [Bacteroidota bacterium]